MFPMDLGNRLGIVPAGSVVVRLSHVGGGGLLHVGFETCFHLLGDVLGKMDTRKQWEEQPSQCGRLDWLS